MFGGAGGFLLDGVPVPVPVPALDEVEMFELTELGRVGCPAERDSETSFRDDWRTGSREV